MIRFELSGKSAIITGAASGIGASIAELFSQQGASVIIADIDEINGRKVAEKIRSSGGRARFFLLDVAEELQCESIAQQVLKEHSRLDILVNNAGIGHVGTILKTKGSDLDRMYKVNVRGIFNMTRSFLPSMIEAGRGNIINLASIGGIVAVRDRLAYCTTKFAVVGLTKSIALDHAKQGIRCNCICPGRVKTPFVEARLKEYPDPESAYREMSETQAIGRMAEPFEIACAALYLASDESNFMTGTDFRIDGGWKIG